MYMDESKAEKHAKRKAKKLHLPLLCLAMFLLGAFLLAALRFATIQSDDVHYHANFALYVNDQRDQFKDFTFYEEVAACSVHDPDDVKTRVHMHNQNPGLVHIHAHGVTWGQFFANLGYTLGDKVVATESGVFTDGQDGNKLSFVLNGQPVQTVEDRVIKSEDKLLINYGKDGDQAIQEHYKNVPNDAHKANSTADPATCSGGSHLTTTDRLKAALGFPSSAH